MTLLTNSNARKFYTPSILPFLEKSRPKKGSSFLMLQWLCVASDYASLLKQNRNYRLYLLSHLCQHTGDWFVRIAALISIERLAPGSATALSMLILVKAIPEILLTSVGGTLADKFDRKKLMILLDALAALTVLSYIYALRKGSLHMLYVSTAFRSTIQAMYEPITKAIVPMFVSDPHDLKRAVTLNGLAWSSMLMIGGVIAGYASSYLGVEACYGK